jgi:hypothetical protein
MQLADSRVLLGTSNPLTEWKVLYVAVFARCDDANGNHSSLGAAAGAYGVIAPRLVAIQCGFRHSEAPRAVMPLRKANMGNTNAWTPLRFGEFRGSHEILHGKPLLETFFAESQIIWRRAIGGCEPSIQSGAHERFVVAEVSDSPNAEGRYQLSATQRPCSLDRAASLPARSTSWLPHDSASW